MKHSSTGIRMATDPLLERIDRVLASIDHLQESVDEVLRMSRKTGESKVMWSKTKQIEICRNSLRDLCRNRNPDYAEKERRKQIRKKINRLEKEIGDM